MTVRNCGPALLLVLVLGVWALAPAAQARSGCDTSGYSYEGVQTLAPTAGVWANVKVRAMQVTSGHVAAWAGVGGAGLGPGGTDEWLQVGISSFPNGTTRLYYEVARPGDDPVYTPLTSVSTGENHQLGLLEGTQPSTWTVWVDGNRVAGPITLAGSHGAWPATFSGEGYDGGVTSCNAYAFRFGMVRVASAPGSWHPPADVQRFGGPGRIVRLRADAFVVNRR